MEFYKYKCSGCGSTRFEKVENGYKCKYCGNIQDVIFTKEEKQPELQENVTETAEPQEEFEEKTKELKSKPVKMTTKFKAALMDLIICVLGGWFGLHKFFKGEIFWGIVYAVTGGIFGIGYVIDIVFSALNLLGLLKAGGGE